MSGFKFRRGDQCTNAKIEVIAVPGLCSDGDKAWEPLYPFDNGLLDWLGLSCDRVCIYEYSTLDIPTNFCVREDIQNEAIRFLTSILGLARSETSRIIFTGHDIGGTLIKEILIGCPNSCNASLSLERSVLRLCGLNEKEPLETTIRAKALSRVIKQVNKDFMQTALAMSIRIYVAFSTHNAVDERIFDPDDTRISLSSVSPLYYESMQVPHRDLTRQMPSVRWGGMLRKIWSGEDGKLLPERSMLMRKLTPCFEADSALYENETGSEANSCLLEHSTVKHWISSSDISFLSIRQLSDAGRVGAYAWKNLPESITPLESTFVQFFEFSTWDYRLDSVQSMMAKLLIELAYDIYPSSCQSIVMDFLNQTYRGWPLEDQFLLLKEMLRNSTYTTTVWVLVNLGDHVASSRWLLARLQHLPTPVLAKFKILFLNSSGIPFPCVDLASLHIIECNSDHSGLDHGDASTIQRDTATMNIRVLELLVEIPYLHNVIPEIHTLLQDAASDLELYQLTVSWIRLVSKQPTAILQQRLSKARPLCKKTLFLLILEEWSGKVYEAPMKTFKFLSLAFRTLTIHEVRDLATSSKYSKEPSLPEIIDLEELASFLPGIATTSSNEVSFSHRNLRAFLLSKDVWGDTPFFNEHQLAVSHGEIAELCIRYLISPHTRELLDSQGELHTDDLPRFHSPLNFLSYAVQHWPKHAKLAGLNFTANSGPLNVLLGDPKLLQLWTMRYWAAQSFIYDSIRSTPTGTLAIFAAHGLNALITELLSRNISEEQNIQGISAALVTASFSGETATVDLLLSTGITDMEAITEASLASVHSGNSDIFRALNDKASNLSLDLSKSQVMVIHAVSLGPQSILKEILASVPSFCVGEKSYGLLLNHAAKAGDMRTVQSILDIFGENTGAGVLIRGILGAVKFGYINVALYLTESLLSLQTGSTHIQLPSTGPDQETISMEDVIQRLLYYCICLDWVQLLIGFLDVLTRHDKIGINLNIPIRTAVHERKDACFKALLDTFIKAEPGTTSQGDISKHMDSIISTAFLIGTEFMISELLKLDISLNRKEYYTCLSNVVKQGSDSDNSDLELLNLLFEQGQRQVTQKLYCDSVTNGLACAVDDNKPAMVKILIQGHPDLERKTLIDGSSTPLYHAVSHGHVSIVATLVKANADVRVRWSACIYGQLEPIHAAADNTAMLRLLLSSNRDVDKDARTSKGETALMFAARWGRKGCVDELLRHGADPSVRRHDGRTVVSIAIEQCSQSIALSILEKALHPRSSLARAQDHLLLHDCVRCNKPDLLQYILLHEVSIDAVDEQGRTALNCINENTDTKIIDMLIRRQASVDMPDNAGFTPLARVVQANRIEDVKLLVDSGANPNSRIGVYGTPLHLACTEGSLAMIEMLVQNGADLNDVSEKSSGTVLQAACQRLGDDETKSKVLAYLLETDKMDMQQTSPWWGSNLSTACLMADLRIMEVLVNRGVDVQKADRFGRRPIHFALYRTLDHVRYLEDHGADLQAEDGLQRNALHFAVVSGRLDLVRYVIQRFKRFVNGLDCDGWTPLFWALRQAQLWDIKSSERTDIIKELKENGAEIMIRADGVDRMWSPLNVAQYNGLEDDIIQLVTPTDEDIKKLKSPRERNWWKNSIAHKLKEAQKFDQSFCDLCLLNQIGSYYECDDCVGHLLCFKCYRSRDMAHPEHTFTRYGDEGDTEFVGEEGSSLEDDSTDEGDKEPEEEDHGNESDIQSKPPWAYGDNGLDPALEGSSMDIGGTRSYDADDYAGVEDLL